MKPLVSCVMPTRERPDFVPSAIDSFLSQRYPNKELIILDDSPICKMPAISSGWPIRVILTGPKTTGAKRNEVNEYARGPIIAHFDDDDYSAPERLEYQVELLLNSDKAVTGFSNLLFWNVLEKRSKVFRTSSWGYVAGTTLLYLKDYWAENRFPDIQKGSDNTFVYDAMRKKAVVPSDRIDLMVARVHDRHTSSKRGIKKLIEPEQIPSAFWANEELRLSYGGNRIAADTR